MSTTQIRIHAAPPPDLRRDRLARRALLGTVVALLGVVALGVASLAGARPQSALSVEGTPWFGVAVDRVAVLLLLLVVGVSATVQAYARRYLRHDPDQGPFVWSTLLLTATSALLVAAATPVTLALAWAGTGWAVVALVGLRRHDPVVAADRRTVRWGIGLGDAALVAAVALVSVTAGTFDLRRAEEVAAAADDLGGWAVPVALLVIVAALSRCAQLPLPGWLPGTLGAPTPVSALLHAGIVNGGGFLLVVAAPLLSAATGAWLLVALAAGATVVWSVVTMAVSADAKGALVRSTSAQMGFMLVTVAAGLPAAALTHLVGHGAYKASLFLGVGGAVHDAARHRNLPSAGPLTGPGLVGVALALAAVAATFAGATVTLGWGATEIALLGFAGVTILTGVAGWLRRRPDGAGLGWGVAGGTAAAGGYVGLVAAVKAFVAPDGLAPATTGPGAWALVGLGVALAIVLAVQAGAPGTAGMAPRLYVAALAATHRTPRRAAARVEQAGVWSRPGTSATPRRSTPLRPTPLPPTPQSPSGARAQIEVPS